MRVAVANAPAGFSLGKPAGVTVEKALTRDLDLVLLFTTSQKDLKSRWPKAIAAGEAGRRRRVGGLSEEGLRHRH